ncbi:MAG: crotonase/enoyl-CoA hydratase family protein [Acidimicrobiales bacterium]|nr:crotonase/enoyl-CoA hydratase family protein [Acidimicrobiales bacterium]
MIVEYEDHGRTAVIRLNRPEARNAVNQELAEALEEAIDRFEDDAGTWTAVLAANGPSFCAGADLKAISGGAQHLGTERGGFAGLVQRERTKPLIAAVDGPAVAGGLEVVLSCDLVVASTAARFGLPEVKRSLIAAAGGLFRLPRALPRNLAMELALTGDHLDAVTAHRYGLVNRLVEPGEVVEAALELAEKLNANAPLAVRATRRAILASTLLDEAEAFRLCHQLSREIFSSEDFAEGPRAFIEKRPPEWKGR